MIESKKYGTFGGVFTPSILTILGVIMYMRLPMIAGTAGLVGTLGIIFIAHLISITTGLSVSSIATDKKVKEGGTYYIISRSLGLPIGGTLGLALFVGLSFSVSLYLIGFSESFLGYFDMPVDINHIRIAGSIMLLLVTIITFISTSLAIKTQYIIMGAIALSLLSIVLGKHDYAPVTPNIFGDGSSVPLILLFAIFFPAVTGFEAGVSMSGDLKDPKRSIPLGTLAAISIGLLVYILLAFFFTYTVDSELLANDPKALFKIALVPQLVIAGIWGATLSSALGSILGAPRILQSTAIDKITPKFFARGAGAAKEPRNALLLTFAIAEAGILIGELDVIARIVTIFFITTYGFLNLTAAFESLTSPDFRPSFKSPAWISIIGSLACFLVMIQLDIAAMIGAVVVLGSLFLILKRRQLVLHTGDTWNSVWASLVRTGLQRLNKSALHNRNWRPNIILFCGQDDSRPHLVELAIAFSGKLGMYSAFEMMETKETDLIKDKRYLSEFGKNDEIQIHQHKCRDIYEGMSEISRVYGFSGVEPDTILMGWSKDKNNKEKFLKTLKSFEKSEFNSILLNYNSTKKYGNKRTIDVWWSGWGSNLTFAIFLLRHLTSSGDWKDAKIRLFVINTQPERAEIINRLMQQIIDQYRITLEIIIINNSISALSREELISRESAGTDLTFVGIPDKQYNDTEKTYEDVGYLSDHLGTFLLLNSSSRFESFDLGLETKQEKEIDKADLVEVELPPLVPSKYLIINEDIQKIDANGQAVLTQLFENAITPVFTVVQKQCDEMLAAINTVFAQLAKLKAIDDQYRRRKTLIKIKNDFYFRTTRIFRELDQKNLVIQKEALENGINWYIERLEKDIQKFPLKLIIHSEKSDLILKKEDHFRVKLFKLGRRLAHPFAKGTIPVKIRYKEIAAFYLRDTRQNFLSSFLAKFQTDLLSQFSEVRAVIVSVDSLLEGLYSKVAVKNDLIKAITVAQESNEERVYKLMSGIALLQNQHRNRLMLEYRKNLQLMSYDMGKADINYRIRQKRRNRKYYLELTSKNSTFSESWHDETIIQVNKIYMEVLLQSFKSRIKDKIEEFSLNISQQLDNRFAMELKDLRAKLETLRENSDHIPELRLTISSFEKGITLLTDFNRFGKDIIQLTDTLPETMTISSFDETMADSVSSEGILNVPLRRITRFYIESRFIGTTYDELEKIAGLLKSSIFVIHDLLSLTRFNLENIPDDLTDKPQLVDQIVKDTCRSIQNEEFKISEIKRNIDELIDKSLDDVFELLSVYKIRTTISEYSWFNREQQGKKVKKKFYAYLDQIKYSFRSLTTRVLYSRSEWILLAKKMLESDRKDSVNQKVLDLVEQVTPDQKANNNLPQFYKNLFSGRSSISEDFWIRREKDEELFITGVRRFSSGHKGGIMVLGERNSGKTAFCRHITEKNFKKMKIHHLFPVYAGSVQVSDFLTELGKVANTQGSVEEIMASFPEGSVLVIHDLELWWERSENGWEVVELLIKLINNPDNNVLFVVNMNPFAFTLMNKLADLQEAFISVIHLRPFDSKEIRNIIIRRHNSSGMKFVLNKREEENISEIRIANLFNKYFNYSGGIPGNALKGWLGNITRVSGNKIHIQSPVLPDNKILGELDESWKVVLIHLIIHKRLTFERINKIFFSDEETTRSLVGSLLRVGLIVEKRDDLFSVNPFIEPHLITELKKEELL